MYFLSRNSKYKSWKSGFLWPLHLVYFPLTSHHIIGSSVIRSSLSLFMGTTVIPIYGDVSKNRHIADRDYGKVADIAFLVYTCQQNCKELHDENFLLGHERWDHATINTIRLSVKKYGARYVIQFFKKKNFSDFCDIPYQWEYIWKE